MISINLLIGFFIVFLTILMAIFADSFNQDRNWWMKILFLILILTVICTIISYILPLSIFIFIGSLYMYVAFAFIILHASRVLGNRKALIFILIAGLIGLTFEILGVEYGIFGNYHYNVPDLLFGLVPITVPITWTVIIYTSYTVTNLFLYGFGGEKPKYQHRLLYLLGFLALLSAIDGLIAVNMDMIMDPVAVSPQLQQWVWVNGGPYYNIPISNFIGWFGVTFLSTIIFRLYESFKTVNKKDIRDYAYAPALYFLLFLQPAVQAISTNNIEYVLIGTTTMMPFVILSLLLFVTRKNSHRGVKQ